MSGQFGIGVEMSWVWSVVYSWHHLSPRNDSYIYSLSNLFLRLFIDGGRHRIFILFIPNIYNSLGLHFGSFIICGTLSLLIFRSWDSASPGFLILFQCVMGFLYLSSHCSLLLPVFMAIVVNIHLVPCLHFCYLYMLQDSAVRILVFTWIPSCFYVLGILLTHASLHAKGACNRDISYCGNIVTVVTVVITEQQLPQMEWYPSAIALAYNW